MKKVLKSTLILSLACLAFAFISPDKATSLTDEADVIKWYTWEEAIKLNETHPKKLFVDVYTDWCGWCKRMDQTTFTDPGVAKLMNKHFYPVKFNAEQQENVVFKNYTLKYIPNAGRKGVHELAYSLLDGKMGYPAFVYLDEKQDRITISPGYKEADAIIKELTFIGEEHYKNKSFNEFSKAYGK